jgi:RNA polymerase sigma-70 factor (ECF subfamily)
MNDDAPLVARAQAGDARAFEVLVNRHGPRVYNLALRLVRDPEEAEDLAQEALVRAWRALGGYRGEARFGTWLYRIVTRVCYDRMPRLAADLAALGDEAEEMLRLADPAPEPAALALASDLAAQLHAAMDGLPPGFRLLLALRHLQELSYADIAAVTGLPEGTVKSGLSRARAQLRAALEADPPAPERAATARAARPSVGPLAMRMG